MAYDNTRREETARTNRTRVLRAAEQSFLQRGFSGTTIREVATAAEVSPEMIYKTFGGKAALLKSVYDVTLVGDEEATPLAARPEAVAVRDAASPAAAAVAYAELARIISSRVDPLLRLVLGASDTDESLAAFARTTEHERRAGSAYYVTHWAEAGWLRDDITVEHAIDSVWALNSPQPRWLLLDHGWSDEDYTRWLGTLIRRTIFGDRDPG